MLVLVNGRLVNHQVRRLHLWVILLIHSISPRRSVQVAHGVVQHPHHCISKQFNSDG